MGRSRLWGRDCLGGVPAVGEEFVEVVDWMSADAREHVAEIGEGFDVQALASGNEAGQYGAGAPTAVTAVEEPVVATHDKGSQAALGPVVVDLQFAVVAVVEQGLPVVQRVIDGIANGTLGEHLGLFPF